MLRQPCCSISDMDDDVQLDPPVRQREADHLCVLIHGLSGHPSHLDYIAGALRQKYPDQLYILAVKGNSGPLTYDGIELGGERVAHEIETAIDELSNQGYALRKLSIVGYSLGGLVARYAIGLLYSKGYFDRLEPVNFTTFATPHVGVRSPSRRNHFWNVLGARTISVSGRQMFMIDSFRDTGKPLLSVLATPGSIFLLGLTRFKHRCVYANIVNDRAAVFYTTGICKTDPFKQLNKVDIPYVKGYAPVIVDFDREVVLKSESNRKSFLARVSSWGVACVTKVPFYLVVFIFVSISSILYIVNSIVQTPRSQKRIRLHEEGKSGVCFGSYRVPLVVTEMRNVVDDMYETVNEIQEPEYLSDAGSYHKDRDRVFRGSSNYARGAGHLRRQKQLHHKSLPQLPQPSFQESSDDSDGRASSHIASVSTPHGPMATQFPTLALTPAQFAIIDSLNSVGFRKYPVYIHKARHSHAAIIVRMPRKGFEEGKIVVRHWLKEEFRI